MSFVVVFWLGPSRMLLSCWPFLWPVTHHWKCCSNIHSTLLYMDFLWPILSSNNIHNANNNNTSSETGQIALYYNATLIICLLIVCCTCFCQPVLWSIPDKTGVSVLPVGWMFRRVSTNKTSQHHVLSRLFWRGRLTPHLLKIQAPATPALFTWSYTGSLWSVDFFGGGLYLDNLTLLSGWE